MRDDKKYIAELERSGPLIGRGTIGGPVTKRIDPEVKRAAEYRRLQREWQDTLRKRPK